MSVVGIDLVTLGINKPIWHAVQWAPSLYQSAHCSRICHAVQWAPSLYQSAHCSRICIALVYCIVRVERLRGMVFGNK